MANDFEKIDLSLPTSDYAQVIFHNIPETYQTDSNIDCLYTITASLVPASRDWVGIYKVGWRSAREYKCFDWSRIPEGYTTGEKTDVSVTFKASSLPKDDGEFYQFCYVTSAGHVRGASTPFQFRRQGADEFVECEDDEDEDILVIKTKTAMLQDELSKAEREKEELSKTIEYLEKEKESLLENLIDSEKKLKLEKEQKVNAEQTLKVTLQDFEAKQTETVELQLWNESLKEKVNIMKHEQESCMKRLDDSDAYIKSLQEKIKALVNEKDALTGQNKALIEEKELFKNHFTSSEGHVKGYLVEIESLRKKLHHEEETSSNTKQQIAAIEAELNMERKRTDNQRQTSSADKLHISDLTESLRNAEDKLQAAERCKELLNEEVSTLRQTFDKLSADLEDSKSETHNYKRQLLVQADAAAVSLDRVTQLEEAITVKEQEMIELEEECNKLKDMETKQTKEQTEEEGSMFALKVAYHDLLHRVDKVKLHKEEAIRSLEEAMAKLRKIEKEKEDLTDDFHQRLRLGQEEYQKRVVECRRLQTELRRALRARHNDKETASIQTAVEGKVMSKERKEGGSQTEELHLQAEDITHNVTEMPATPSETEELFEVIVTDPDLVELTASELQEQLEQLGQELETRHKKKQKYKTLYQEEKEKRAHMQKHYFNELKKKDADVNRLKQQLQDSTAVFQHRIITTETVIADQKELISQLRQKGAPQVPMYPPQVPYTIRPYVPVSPHPHPNPPHFYPPQVLTPQMIPLIPFSGPNNFPPKPPVPMQLPIGPPVPPRNRDGLLSPTQKKPAPEPELPSPLQTDSDPGNTPVIMRDEELAELDPLYQWIDSGDLDSPQTSLPPPMSPSKSVDALVAEVRAVNGAGISSQTSQTEVKDTHIVIDPNAEEDIDEEERFHDAEEGPAQEPAVTLPSAPPAAAPAAPPAVPLSPLNIPPMMTDVSFRTCPVCSMVFPGHILERDIIQHVEAHINKLCPVCSKIFEENCPQDEYEGHVQEHFTAE